METPEVNVVTGAFGFTGKYITRRLLARGVEVRTLTGHPGRPNPFGPQVYVYPFNFDRPDELAKSLEGATTLYNTYWVRFNYGSVTFERAVENTGILLRAAEEAGVRRIVHISITNASPNSPFPYFRGKGLVEEAVKESRLSHAIVRPAVLFGAGDILINNIAWLLRRYPVFAIFGRGDYRLQPVYVEDVADLAVDLGGRGDNVTVDAVGPEIYTFEELVRLIAAKLGRRVRLVHVRPEVGLALGRLIGRSVRDVLITEDEIRGLMTELLVSPGPPTCPTRFSDWLERNARVLGTEYASELARHYR
ncbi:MAG: NAD(P)H-binding protein [Firmicutes bacterium]|nr:NAD(P)H-binding protein [Bacillota bacterium]